MTDLAQPAQVAPLVIADVTVDPARRLIRTPLGVLPLAGSTWAVGTPEQIRRVPAWAIAIGVVLAPFTCGLSLLLLLVKAPTGAQLVPVTVAGEGGIAYTTRVRAADYAGTQWVQRAVNYARMLAADSN